MVCSIADNRPIKRLEKELGITPRCHGKRRECLLGFESQSGDFVMGLPGTALGYCQALFQPENSPETLTTKMRRLLMEINAPWHDSHELFWGYRGTMRAQEYIASAMAPLIGTGRVPILISALDPARDADQLADIMSSKPAIPKNEAVLVRMMLNDDASIAQAVKIMESLVNTAKSSGVIPSWWPLFQAGYETAKWSSVKDAFGDLWPYVNVAVNGFTPSETIEMLADQITVAQVPVGLSEGISNDGNIEIQDGMFITGAESGGHYNIYSYFQELGQLPKAPTLIVLGPTKRSWTDEMNQLRLATLLPQLRKAVDILWGKLTPSRRDEVWSLAA